NKRLQYKTKISNLRKASDMWSMMRTLQKMRKGEPQPPLILNGEELIYPAVKAEKLSQFYQHQEMIAQFNEQPEDQQKTRNVGREVKRINQQQGRAIKVLLDHPEEVPSNDLLNANITIGEVEEAQKKLTARKAAGPDGIKPEMLIHLKEEAVEGITKLFNLSWSTGMVPNGWKKSIEHPIPKPGKPTSQGENLRPISLTSNICKWMERVMAARLYLWLLLNNKLTAFQAASRPQRETTDQLHRLKLDIDLGFNKRQNTLAAFIDLKQAFDSVWVDQLIVDLNTMGIKGRMLKWIIGFLKDRSFRVRYDGALSSNKKKIIGIPQGTVLSPLLFTLFLNDIEKVLPEGVNIALFADDIAIWTTNKDDATSMRKINEALENLRKYLKDKRLFLNVQKTKGILFSKCRRETIDNKNIELKFGEDIIEMVGSIRYLGLDLDQKLTFEEHIRRVTSKAQQRLGIIKMMTGTTWGLDLTQLRQVYLAIGQALTNYGCTVWQGVLKAKSWRQLSIVQNRAINIITKTPISAPVEALQIEANISPTRNQDGSESGRKIREYHEDAT
ncbi:MAG: reverse transcriptase family protein, partial [Gammaproteobacteria bacterium]|nr:reverse transcriptase family protein [Gammaproteobacteria bacterium]